MLAVCGRDVQQTVAMIDEPKPEVHIDDVDADQDNHSPMLITHLPTELQLKILTHLPSAFDRFFCSQVSREWAQLVHSKAAWVDCTGLVIYFQNSSFPGYKLARDHIGFLIYNPAGEQSHKFDQPVLTWQQLSCLWMLLPPITQLKFSRPYYCVSNPKFPANTFERLSQMLLGLPFKEDDQPQSSKHNHYSNNLPLTELKLNTNCCFARVLILSAHSDPHYYDLCVKLVLERCDRLHALSLPHNAPDDLLLAADHCTRLQKLSLKLHSRDNTNAPLSFDLIASKWHELQWLRVNVRTSSFDGHLFLADLLKVVSAGVGPSVHLVISFCYGLALSKDRQHALHKLFSPKATALVQPLSQIKSISLKHEVYVEHGRAWPIVHVHQVWLRGLILHWCPALERLVLPALFFLRDCTKTVVHLVQFVLSLFIQRDQDGHFELVVRSLLAIGLSLQMHSTSRFINQLPSCKNGYDEENGRSDRMLQQLLLKLGVNGKGYSCTKESLPPPKGTRYHPNIPCTCKSAWKLTIVPDPHNPDNKFIVCAGAQ